jgi:hypothetical protein
MLSKYNSNITAAEEILHHYDNGNSYVILLAQMQSGKSLCYWNVAFEQLRLNKSDSVIIFSGNRENELKKQSSCKREAFDIYTSILFEKGIEFGDKDDLANMLFPKIKIIWGTELLKTKKEDVFGGGVDEDGEEFPLQESLLFIWEESHFGQSKKQHVDLFLQKMGISAKTNGCINKTKILSVSATPFSELCNVFSGTETEKKIVRMIPSTEYRGVKWYFEQKKIHGILLDEEDILEENYYLNVLNDCFSTPTSGKKWAIIRCCKLQMKKKIIKLIDAKKWGYCNYDMTTSSTTAIKGKCIMNEIYSFTDLENPPIGRSTVIFVKGLCRMGTVVPKKHVSFVMELSSEESNTDTILQGLLGRMCGYISSTSMPMQPANIYIPQLITTSGEIERYIQFNQTMESFSIPHCAMNVRKPNKSASSSNTFIVPIHIPHTSLSDVSSSMKGLHDDIISLLYEFNEEKINNYNSSYLTLIIKDVLQNTEANCISISVKKLKRTSSSYAAIPGKLKKTVDMKTSINLGVPTKPNNMLNVLVLKIDDDYPDFVRNDCYIQFSVHNEVPILKNTVVPLTTHNEVFY